MANLALNGRSIDNLEEVASNFFDPEILDAYRSGLLHEWLIDQGYDSEASQIEKLEDHDDTAVLDNIIAALNLDMEMVKMAREARIAAAKAEREESRDSVKLEREEIQGETESEIADDISSSSNIEICEEASQESATCVPTQNGIGLSPEEIESPSQDANGRTPQELIRLGFKYLYGIDGVDEDKNKAFDLFSKSAEMGDSEAWYWIGHCYENGYGVVEDDEKAFKAYKRSAVKGDGDAQNKVGEAYYFGCGVEMDDEMAFKWFKKSADRDCAEGQFWLAKCLRSGYGCEQDNAAAMVMFRKAADKGDAEAQYELAQALRLGEICEKDPERAIEWYLKSAEQGNANALCVLGLCYHEGQGVETSLKKAEKYYRLAIENGDDVAMYNLGILLRDKAVRRNNKQLAREAVKWLERAALKEVDGAQEAFENAWNPD